jgi:hypothetical protein
MKTIFYKGEDITLNFSSESDMSGYTKVVKYFTPFSSVKTAVLTPIDNYSFTASLVKEDTADLTAGTLNVVIEFTQGDEKSITKTAAFRFVDAYTDGGERTNVDVDIDVVFTNDIYIDINFVGLNLKTINGQSLLGTGNVTIEANPSDDSITYEKLADDLKGHQSMVNDTLDIGSCASFSRTISGSTNITLAGYKINKWATLRPTGAGTIILIPPLGRTLVELANSDTYTSGKSTYYFRCRQNSEIEWFIKNDK